MERSQKIKDELFAYIKYSNKFFLDNKTKIYFVNKQYCI